VQGSAPFDAVGLTAIANLVITWWNTDLAPNLGVGYNLNTVQVRSMETEEAPGVEVLAPNGSGGDVASPLMPGNVALAVKLKSGFTGRNRQGRIFQGGFVESQQEGNEVTLATRDNIVNAYEQLRAQLAAANTPLAVASYYNGMTLQPPAPNGTCQRTPTPRATALVTPVIDIVADTYIDSQRRRLAGRGV